MPYEPDGGGGESQEQLATVWDTIGDYFASLGESVASVPIIGGILSTPFLNIAERFYMAGNVTRGFREFYDRAIAVVEALASGEAWEEILDIVFPEWRAIRDWLQGAGEGIADSAIVAFLDRLAQFLRGSLYVSGVWLAQMLENIVWRPVEWVQTYAPFAYQLWYDLTQFNTWQEFFDWLGDIGLDLFDPVAIISSVLSRIFQWIQDHIPEFVPWLMVVGEQILRYALEGEFTQPDVEPPIIE